MGGYAIETIGLTKVFDGLRAVDSLNVKILKGELFGFLGPNGAGKTTTINMLTTLLSPTSGTAKVAGYDIIREVNEVRRRIGVVPQTPNIYPNLTAMENMLMIGDLYDIPRSKTMSRAKELLDMVELWDRKDDLVKTYSGGMKQRLSIALGLLHKPEILFMDEPTTGLDPQTKMKIRETARELARDGITIVYTTHDMDEADRLCERIAIMDHGKLLAVDEPRGLKKLVESKTSFARIECKNKEFDAKVRLAPFTRQVFRRAGNVEVVFEEGEASMNSLGEMVKECGGKILEIQRMEPTMEDVFITLTGRKLRK